MNDQHVGGHRIAIVGAGAAGLATASNLVGLAPGVQVDLIDKAPTPFGLLRYGVAPDHENNRRTLLEYAKVFENPGVRFLGGVEFGRDVRRADLLGAYDAVVYATGASEDRLLDVAGEALPGVRSGRAFSAWYTGDPTAPAFDLTGVTNVVIVGLGDVAVDLARMLLKSPAALADSDMPQPVLDHLAAHRVREVTILVRRGPGDCQLKTRDLVELLNLPAVAVRFDKGALDIDEAQLTPKAKDALPVWRAAADREYEGTKARLKIKFWTRPTEMRGRGVLEGVKIEKTKLDPAGRLVSAGGEDMIPAQLLLRATGARGLPIDDVPFDQKAGVIPTRAHRVIDLAGAEQPGEYAAGWIANGWVGGFGTQRRDGAAVAEQVLGDLQKHTGSIDGLLAARGVRPIGIDGWERVEEAEQVLGAARDRERIKIADPGDLMEIARGD